MRDRVNPPTVTTPEEVEAVQAVTAQIEDLDGPARVRVLLEALRDETGRDWSPSPIDATTRGKAGRR